MDQNIYQALKVAHVALLSHPYGDPRTEDQVDEAHEVIKEQEAEEMADTIQGKIYMQKFGAMFSPAIESLSRLQIRDADDKPSENEKHGEDPANNLWRGA